MARIPGAFGNETRVGTQGNDVFESSLGNDLMIGLGGNDVFEITATTNTDHYNGGEGFDQIIVKSVDQYTTELSLQIASIVDVERIASEVNHVDTYLVAGGFPLFGDSTSFSGTLNLRDVELVNIKGIRGGSGNDTIIGSDGAGSYNGFDFIEGGTGADTLTGGLGNDTFQYKEDFGQDFGKDVITDFTVGEDKIEFETYFFSNFGEVEGLISQVGDDTLIEIDANNSILLQGVDATTLGASDFAFV